MITSENASRIQSKVIAEAANGPISFDADEVLQQKGIFIIPDAYLNAGGVTVSYFEWLKNLSHVRFGRMDKRFAEAQNAKILRLIETGIGKPLDKKLADDLLQGPAKLPWYDQAWRTPCANPTRKLRRWMTPTKR